MGYLKKLLQAVVSVFIPFVILAKLGNTYIPYQAHPAAHENEFTFYDIRVYFSHIMPLLFAVAFLIQILFVIPIWNKILTNQKNIMIAFFIALVIVTGISFGLSYIIWDSSNGLPNLVRSASVLIYIQIIYLVPNMLILFIFDKLFKEQPIPPDSN